MSKIDKQYLEALQRCVKAQKSAIETQKEFIQCQKDYIAYLEKQLPRVNPLEEVQNG